MIFITQCDSPALWQIYLSDPVNIVKERILMFNEHLLFLLTVIILLAWLLLFYTVYYFTEYNNKFSSKFFYSPKFRPLCLPMDEQEQKDIEKAKAQALDFLERNAQKTKQSVDDFKRSDLFIVTSTATPFFIKGFLRLNPSGRVIMDVKQLGQPSVSYSGSPYNGSPLPHSTVLILDYHTRIN